MGKLRTVGKVVFYRKVGEICELNEKGNLNVWMRIKGVWFMAKNKMRQILWNELKRKVG